MSHNPSHIIVTPKGLELQVQLLREVTASNFPHIRSPQNVVLPRKQNHSTSVQTSLTPFPLPRSGYFGPKERTISIADPSQDYLFFPNYLHKSPTDNTQRHFCVWRPSSTTKSAKSIEPVIPKGRYIHHSLFNHAVDTRVGEDPSVEMLNRMTFGGRNGSNVNTSQVHHQSPANSRKLLDVTEIKESMVLDSYLPRNQSQMLNKSILNNSNHLRSTGSWGRFRGTRNADWEIKEEKFIEKRQTQEKEYEKMLQRFAEETAKTRLKHEENQNEPPEFVKKMKAAEKDIQTLKGKKFNEDSRYVKRLKDFQSQKYEKTWKNHEWSQMNSTVTGDKFIAKKKGIRGGALYNTSGIANMTQETDKSKLETDHAQKLLLRSSSSKVLGGASPKNDQKFLDFVKMQN